MFKNKEMKIGDKVRVIDKQDEFYGKIGKIVNPSVNYDWFVKFKNKEAGLYYNSDLQLIKPVRKWKYTRKEIGNFLNKTLDNFFEETDGGNIQQLNQLRQDLLAKSEHTEDKSGMLKQAKCNDINDNCYYKGNCYFKSTGKGGSVLKKPVSSTLNSRPTLKGCKHDWRFYMNENGEVCFKCRKKRKTTSRPTLKPIEPIKKPKLIYELCSTKCKDVVIDIDFKLMPDMKKWIKIVTDRINLLSEERV